MFCKCFIYMYPRSITAVINSNLGPTPILPHFRDIAVFLLRIILAAPVLGGNSGTWGGQRGAEGPEV